MAQKRKEYIITDGKKYIREDVNGRFTTTNNITLASVFERANSAEGILKNAVSLSIRRGMYVAEIINGEVVKLKYEIVRPEKLDKTSSGKTVKFDFKDDALDKTIKIVSDFEELIKVSEHRSAQILTDLQKVEAEKDEILHAIESKNVNACKACQLEVELRDVLRKRRRLKNELQVIKSITKVNSIKKDLLQMTSSITALGEQVYKPCLRPDLFA